MQKPLTKKTEILQDTDPRCAELEAAGYSLVGQSWGARLSVDGDIERFLTAIEKAIRFGIDVRKIWTEFAEEVLRVEIANNSDYPITPATSRPIPTIEVTRELWAPNNLMFGALSDGVLIGVLATSSRESLVELDFASILRDYRGKGIGKALAAAAILEWVGQGIYRFGTGGASENEASLGTVESLGFSIDEKWRSYQPPL